MNTFALRALTIIAAAGTLGICTALASPPGHDDPAPSKPSATKPLPLKKPTTKVKPALNLPKYDDAKGGTTTPPVNAHKDEAGSHGSTQTNSGDDHGNTQAHDQGHAATTGNTTTGDTHSTDHASAHTSGHSVTNVSTNVTTGNSSADEALTWLREGNQRWIDNKSTAPNTTADRLTDTANNGQKPFVTIITCSDSRIPVERVFDRGVGELFVVRVAGNRAAGSETGTVEYGVGHLHTPLLVVMGHTKCGAVAAAASGAKLHGKVAELVAGIQPAVDRARKQNPSADEATLTSLAIRENIWQTVFDLYKTSPDVRDAVNSGSVKVVGALYDINTGKVEFMGEHPWQSELLTALAPTNTTGTTAAVDENK